MNCMKCGRETAADQVFCQDCLLEMQKYPVKPGTAVMLPKRREASAIRKPVKRRAPSMEDQLKALRKRLRLMTILLLIAIAAIVCLSIPTAKHLMERRLPPGQNYSSIVTTTAPTSPPSSEAVPTVTAP